MGVKKIRGALSVAGAITDRAGVFKATSGTFDIGADVRLTRSAADTLALASGDILDLSGAAGLRVPNGTAALGTALTVGNGGIRIATVNGTPALGFQHNGTVFYALKDGNT